MAFIYRYHIREKNARNLINLTNYNDDIVNTIRAFYGDNLKDCRVEETFYEYRLHFGVDNNTLRQFGKELIANCSGVRSIREHLENESAGIFVRKENEYYGFFDIDDDEDELKLSLIDALDFNDLERFTMDARSNFNFYIESNNIDMGNINRELDTLSRAFYMDVFTLYDIDCSSIKMNSIYENKKSSRVMLIKGFHSKNSDYGKVKSELDVAQLIKLQSSENDYVKDLGYADLDDGFKISEITLPDEDKVKEILKALELHIQPTNKINNCSRRDYKKINFTVHNVGQALATSLSELKKPPFLYFDFGISEGANLFNRPATMTIDASGKPSIVISHIHRDHWYGITVFTDAFKCNWYIPNQNKETLFKKRCAEIIASGGSVNYVIASITFNIGTIFVGETSKHSPMRMPNHKHENGLAMNVKLRCDKKNIDVNILVPGDLRYDYIPQTYLSDIDILVASHHGGSYSWSKRNNVNDDIKYNTKDGLIIYSYGEDNTHNHPTKENDYIRKGWTKNHKTAIDLDFRLK